MRVTHVITRLIVGGAQENTLASVLGLRQKPGLEVDLISGPTRGREGSLEPMAAATPGVLTILPDLVRAVNPWRDWLAYRALRRRFLETRPAIVHTHSGKAGILGRRAAHAAGVPIVIHSIHGPSFGPFQGPVANAVFCGAERRAARWTHHFIVVANAMRDQYLAAGIGSPEQFTRIFSGFPLEPFLGARRSPEMARRLGLEPDAFVVGTVARLFKLKGHDDLFEAAPELIRRCPKIRFLLVGDGPWRGRFEAQLRARGLADRFVFAGLVPPSEVAGYIAQMDVLVHLSRREGLARVLPQALAAGVPVVAADCDGASEVCLDQQTGFLIRPGDATGLVSALVALERNSDLRRRLGETGREFVRERFGVARLVDAQFELYGALARARGLGGVAGEASRGGGSSHGVSKTIS